MDECWVYEIDVLMVYCKMLFVVVLLKMIEEVSVVLKYCYDIGVKVVLCGVGMFFVGGVILSEDVVVFGFLKMNWVFVVNYDDCFICVEVGVINLSVMVVVVENGFFYVLDFFF